MAHAEETLRRLINKIAKEQKYENHEVIINEISSGGANYTSKLFTAIIKGTNKEDLHLFAKVAILGEKFRSEVPVNVFETERFAYLELGKIYTNLEEESKVPEEHRLFLTKYYGYDPTMYQETLVLQNLVAHGYNSFDRFNPMSWEYASSAITELAKFHALSFAFNKKNPEEFERTCSVVLKMDMPEGVMDVMMQNATDLALKNVQSENKESLEKYLNVFKKDLLLKLYTPVRSTVIAHGDFRGSNLLHRVREDGKVDIKIVDLQTLQAGCPVSDLIYFIFTGSDEEFRAKYYEKLIDHYYTQLSAAMKRLHLDPEEVFSREDFEYELKEKLSFGLGVAVLGLPMITVETENAPQIDNEVGLDMSTFAVHKTSDIYPARLNGVVADYIKWGLLKR